MKVALFTDTYDQVNGVANTFRYFTEYCRANDVALHVYTHAEGKDSVEDLGSVRIYRFQPAMPLDIYFDMVFDLKLPRFRLLKAAGREKYDLIHTATPGSIGLHALALADWYGIPLISTYHTSLPEYLRDRIEHVAARWRVKGKQAARRGENLTWKFMQWYYNQTKLVLAPSEATRAQLETKLNTQTGVFTRGIDTERFHPKFREARAGVSAIYVGRVSTEKNLGRLCTIFRGRDDVGLIVVGDGPYRKEMEQELPGAAFTGFLKGEALSKAYASADLFVFPSTTDTFGNVVLEGMSSGLPAVVTDQMGPKEMVSDGVTGFVARESVAGEFAERVDRLVKDAALRKQMGQAAREYALTRDWDTVFAGLVAQYRRYAGREERSSQ